MKFKTRLTVVLMTLFLTCLPTILLLAQGDPGGDPDENVPFDGGISILVAAGIGYAVKKGYDRRKKNKEAKENSSL
jgi:hypothetical protein